MTILAYIIASISVIAAFLMSGSSLLLARIFMNAHIHTSNQDWYAGLIIVIIAMLYLIHPAITFWLIWQESIITSLIVGIISIGLSAFLTHFVWAAIEVAVRP